MATWDEDYINEEVQAFIEFDDKGSGDFQFGYVQGTWTAARPHGTASQPSSGPGRATTRWTRRRAGAGPC